MSHRLLTLMSGLLIAAAGCSHKSSEGVEPKPPPAVVEVTNHYALTVEVYVLGGGSSQRLGVVNPGLVSRFQIPYVVLASGGVVFQAGPNISAQMYNSGELFIHPGSVVDLEVAAVLFNSTATIRP